MYHCSHLTWDVKTVMGHVCGKLLHQYHASELCLRVGYCKISLHKWTRNRYVFGSFAILKCFVMKEDLASTWDE